MVEKSNNFFMFYGMLNLDGLAQYLPFQRDLTCASTEEKLAVLKSKAVALTCKGWTRVFTSQHASI